MKTIKETQLPSGKTRITVEIGERERLLAIEDHEFYQLSEDGDVVPAHFIYDAQPVAWCPFSQKWV